MRPGNFFRSEVRQVELQNLGTHSDLRNGNYGRALNCLQHVARQNGPYAGRLTITGLRPFTCHVQMVDVSSAANGEHADQTLSLGHPENLAKSIGIVCREL